MWSVSKAASSNSNIAACCVGVWTTVTTSHWAEWTAFCQCWYRRFQMKSTIIRYCFFFGWYHTDIWNHYWDSTSEYHINHLNTWFYRLILFLSPPSSMFGVLLRRRMAAIDCDDDCVSSLLTLPTPPPTPPPPQAPVVSSLHVLPLPHPQWNAPGLRSEPTAHLSPEHLHQGPAGPGDGVTLHRALPQLWEHLQGERSVWPVTSSPTWAPLAHACGGRRGGMRRLPSADTFGRYNFVPTLSSMYHRS